MTGGGRHLQNDDQDPGPEHHRECGEQDSRGLGHDWRKGEESVHFSTTRKVHILAILTGDTYVTL